MGLLDQVLGGVLGSRGQGSQPSLSPVVKALLMVLATKAIQHYRSGQAPHGEEPSGGDQFDPGRQSGPTGPLGGFTEALYPPGSSDRGNIAEGPGSGSPLGGADLSGGLGGLIAGLGGAGGLESLLDQFRQSGYGDAMDSWVGRGENQRLRPQQLAEALGPNALDELEQQTGMGRNGMLSELSNILPEAVDEFTPEGRPPTEPEIGRWI